MGRWGSGLYANDTAADLRPLVSTALKLPRPIGEIVDLVVDREALIACDLDHEDHTTFWLVLADRIWTSGDRSERVFSKAIDIIVEGRDLRMCQRLGMTEADLRKRAQALEALRKRLETIHEGATRTTLAKPKTQLFRVGDVLTVPIDEQGEPANPYFSAKHLDQTFTPVSAKSCVIVEVGRAFGFFPWYRPLVQRFEDGRPIDEWAVMHPGTISPSHRKKMGLVVRTRVDLSPAWMASRASQWAPGDSFAVSDISMANSLRRTEPPNTGRYRRAEWEA